MLKQEQGLFPQTEITSESKVLSDDGLVTSENNRSVWGLVINNTLKNTEGKFNKYRYMSISLEINGRDLLLAEGIWSRKEALKIKERIKNNFPNVVDFSEAKDELGNKTLCSKCNTQVFNYLVFKKVITEKDDSINGKYKIFYPHIFGEDISPVDIDINATESDRIGYTQLEICVSTKSKEELIK